MCQWVRVPSGFRFSIGSGSQWIGVTGGSGSPTGSGSEWLWLPNGFGFPIGSGIRWVWVPEGFGSPLGSGPHPVPSPCSPTHCHSAPSHLLPLCVPSVPLNIAIVWLFSLTDMDWGRGGEGGHTRPHTAPLLPTPLIPTAALSLHPHFSPHTKHPGWVFCPKRSLSPPRPPLFPLGTEWGPGWGSPPKIPSNPPSPPPPSPVLGAAAPQLRGVALTAVGRFCPVPPQKCHPNVRSAGGAL